MDNAVGKRGNEVQSVSWPLKPLTSLNMAIRQNEALPGREKIQKNRRRTMGKSKGSLSVSNIVINDLVFFFAVLICRSLL